MVKNQLGFAHIFALIAIMVVVLGSIGYSIYNKSTNTILPLSSDQPVASESAFLQGSVVPKNMTTPKPGSNPTTKPTYKTSPTPSAQTGSSATACSYDLNAATGSVKVSIQAQNGSVIGDQIVEIQAKSGCNVLVNKSANKDIRIAKQGNPVVDFSSVPPGTYDVRVQYKGQWTSFESITVTSAHQTIKTIMVSGDTPVSTPVPTSKPKPTCSTPSVYPSSSGPAPLSVQLSGFGMAGAAGGMASYEWDFTGDGSWDATGSLNPPSYTYQSAGTYTVKMRLLATNGEYSDTCETTIIVN